MKNQCVSYIHTHTHDRSETYVLQGNNLISYQSLLSIDFISHYLIYIKLHYFTFWNVISPTFFVIHDVENITHNLIKGTIRFPENV